MARSPPKAGRVSVTEYLRLEAAGPARHELIDGRLHGLRTPALAHHLISGNLYLFLQEHLRAGPCRTFVADVRVRVEAADAFLYPDLVVSCDERDLADGATVRWPRLVIEVVATAVPGEAVQERLDLYRRLPTLVEYVRVSEDEPEARAYRRGPGGDWSPSRYVDDDALELAALGVRVPLDLIYASF